MKKSSSKSAKKVATEAIPNDRNRQITFSKRKWGLLKKAYELSTLCDCQIGLVIFSNNNKLYEYASTHMDTILLRYTEHGKPQDSYNNDKMRAKIVKRIGGPSDDNDGPFDSTGNTEPPGSDEDDEPSDEDDDASNAFDSTAAPSPGPMAQAHAGSTAQPSAAALAVTAMSKAVKGRPRKNALPATAASAPMAKRRATASSGSSAVPLAVYPPSFHSSASSSASMISGILDSSLDEAMEQELQRNYNKFMMSSAAVAAAARAYAVSDQLDHTTLNVVSSIDDMPVHPSSHLKRPHPPDDDSGHDHLWSSNLAPYAGGGGEGGGGQGS